MKKSEKTRQMIIEKAASLFNRKGFSGTSMSDIMVATGLSKGGIYGNFKREGLDKTGVKEEIAIEAFEHAVHKVYNSIRERTAVIENSLDKLKAVVYFYRERLMCPPVEGGCPILKTTVDTDESSPELKARVLHAVEEWKMRIARTLEKGIEKGEVARNVDVREFATLFIGSIEGGFVMARAQQSNQPFDIMSKQLLDLIENLRPNEIK
jgi:AcrR family transcriptional regulator